MIAYVEIFRIFATAFVVFAILTAAMRLWEILTGRY